MSAQPGSRSHRISARHRCAWLLTLCLGAAAALPFAVEGQTALPAPPAGAQAFWFANGGFIGKARTGDAVIWLPGAAGRYQVRVIDQAGRSDGREVKVEFVP